MRPRRRNPASSSPERTAPHGSAICSILYSGARPLQQAGDGANVIRADRWVPMMQESRSTSARRPEDWTSLYSIQYSDVVRFQEESVAMAQAQTIPLTRHPFADGSFKQMLIDGKWVDAASGKRFESRNPATGELLATVAEGDAEDINRAVAAARKAFEGPWRKFKPYERQALLLKLADLVERHFDELSALDTLDMGAPISRTRSMRLRVLGMLRYYAGQLTFNHSETTENSLPGEIFSYTLKEPVGVVGAIIPWNGPLGASVWKIGPALATGCTVILKPAEEAPLTSLRLAELALEAGAPEGVVNVVPGYGETAGAALAAHTGVDKVAFTGSHVTGQSIVKASAGNLKRVSLELGGKSPDIVFQDADLEAAIPGAAMAVFANSGQICPLVSAQQFERVTEYLTIGRKEGATALAGGAAVREGSLGNGYFVPPTV